MTGSQTLDTAVVGEALPCPVMPTEACLERAVTVLTAVIAWHAEHPAGDE